jgi:hypothetical protein
MDKELKEDLDCWVGARNAFLTAHEFNRNGPKDYLFCDPEGSQLKSNYLAQIARMCVGGSVTEMRKAHYYLVSDQPNSSIILL